MIAWHILYSPRDRMNCGKTQTKKQLHDNVGKDIFEQGCYIVWF